MLNFCLGVLAILAGFWKSLGRLFPKKWLSKRPSVGFARIFSLKGTDLEEKALATLTAALQVNLPLRAAGVHVEYLAVSVGLIAGFRVQASKVKVVLEQLSEESDWAVAEEAICSAQKGKGAAEAKQSISLVEKAKKPTKPLGGAAARFLEVFACGVRLDIDELLVVIKGPEGQEDIEVTFGLHARTSRSWAIEWRGAHAHLAASCRIRAGGQELLAPASVEVSADLPRVLQTMMVPSILPNKRAVAQVSLADIKLQLQPASVAALARISDTVNQFKGWKDAVVAEERSQVVALGFGERALYTAALAGGKKDVSEWEQRMTGREILQARCEAQQWPVPAAMQLEEWLADLADRQKPLRALKMEMSLRSFTVEVLREGESPGSGCSARLEDMRFSGQFTAMDPRKPEDNNNSSKNEPDACPSGGQPKLRAQLCIRSLQIQCEPANTFAAPVLMPFALSGECSHDALEQKDSLSVRLRVSEVPQVPLNTLNTAVSTSDSTDEDADSPAPVAIKATVSSRSVWRLQSAARGLKDAAAAAQLASSRVPTRVPSASTLTAQEQKTKHVEEIRAAAHTEEIKLLFESLDTDHSGLLEFAELRELLESMYHVYMTPEEMGMATTQLFHRLKDASDGVSFQALSQFFIELSKGPGALENLCLELHEFNRPVPSNFVAEKAFAALLATDKASHPAQQGLAAEVLQLRWVRTLQNYQVAKETWLQDLAPTLEPRLRRWQLHDGMQAIDFWCDPMFSLRKQAMADQKQKKALTVNFDFKLDGLSVRLADTQHASSVPRAKLDMMGLELKGGVHRAADSSGFAPLERGLEGGGGLAGEVMFSAEYWNQSQRIVEPFVEPWKLELAGDENCLSIKAEQHAVLNITPPILQALTVFANSLKMQDAQLALSKLHQLEAKPVAAWVFNRTLCDVKVRAKGPSGMGDAVEISRWDFAEPFAIELKSTTSLERSKTFGGDSSGAHDSLLAGGGEERWYLEIEVRGGDGEDKSVGEGWWVRELVPFATTGRRLLRVGQHHLCVDFTVDVHTLAPVVSLSGISVLQNMTSRALTVNLGANRPDGQPRTVLVEPYQSWNGGISGGYEVSLPLEGGLPSDRRHLTLPLPLDSSDLGDGERVLQSQAGYRFVLLAHAGKLGKGEVRDRNVVCVPLLSVLNALPCEVVCSIRSQLPRRRRRQLLVHMDSEDPHDAGIEPFQPHPEPEPPLEVQPEPHTQKLSSGQKLGFNDVDPELPVEVAISFAGFAYNGVIPANSLRSRRAVAQSLRSGRFQLVSDDAAAPLLDVELDWEVQGAVMAVFSRYWVSDKTGWSLEASSGADMLHNAADAAMLKTQETARAVPIPPQGTWSCDASDSAVDATLGEIQTPSESAPPPIAGLPRLALMRVASEYLQVRLMQGRHGQSLKGWAWADGCEGPLQTWWGGHSLATDSGSNGHAQQSSEDAAEQTGWSSALSVGIVGSTGVAQLPSPSILGLGSLPAAEVGLSVAGLPAPFERTKLVTVAPRYVVRNNLEQPLDIWPIRGNSRKAPFPSDHLLGNWKSEESSDAAAGSMRISTFAITSTPGGQLFFCGLLPDGHTVFGDLSAETPEGFFQAELHGYVRQGAVGEVRLRLDRSMNCLVTNCRPFDQEGENGTEQVQTEAASWQPDIFAYSEDAPSICMVSPSASLSIGAIPQTSGYLSAAASSETMPMISVRMSASGRGDPNSGPTAWSVRLPLSTVGDTVFALAAPGGGGVPRVVRASVQLEGSTLFIVLSKGQWPYVIENRSVIHTVAFHQEGLSPAAAGCEWVLRPCEARRFVFPDPDKPKILLGRIVGAGESHVARYQLEDVSTGGQQPSLTIPGHDKAALGARVKAIGASCCLLLSDPEAVRQDASTEQAASVNDVIDGKDQASVISKLGLDVFLAGFHVCLVDTLRATPQELLGFTVDYVQLEKPRNKRSIALTVHHAQLDDFGDENSFVFGPLESGLNSRTSAVADKQGFAARPMLSCCLEGPFDWSIKLYDTDHRAITLKSLLGCS
ncbi:unnamed protein product [Polarella glacialis]|uniref:EF-hand domain-containing protein n=1 Tax=Polarella glacialis TaxID=89957 RepID=A0A813I4R7_POLGL|nr:unnamed protein product [Polarella glacialis]